MHRSEVNNVCVRHCTWYQRRKDRCHSLQIESTWRRQGVKRPVSLQKAVIKKEKGQMPFPTDRALNDADKVKTGLYRDKKNHKCTKKKDKMMAYSSLPLRTQLVVPLFPFTTPIIGNWLANTALLVSMLFSLIRSVWIAMTTAAIPVDELVPPLNNY